MVQRPTGFSVFADLGRILAFFVLAAGSGCAGTPPASNAATATPSSTALPSAKADDTLSHGGASLFVVHLMSDFDGFKKYFEEGATARANAGIKGHLLTRLDDERAVVHLFADDAAKVEEQLKSPEMERYLDRKGAPDSSLVWLTENELVKLPAVPPSQATYSLFLKLRVSDFAALTRGFEQNLSLFAEHAVVAEGLHHSIRQPDIAILHFMGTSREKLEALPKRPEFAQLLASSGSSGELKPLIGVDVSRSRPVPTVSP